MRTILVTMTAVLALAAGTAAVVTWAPGSAGRMDRAHIATVGAVGADLAPVHTGPPASTTPGHDDAGRTGDATEARADHPVGPAPDDTTPDTGTGEAWVPIDEPVVIELPLPGTPGGSAVPSGDPAEDEVIGTLAIEPYEGGGFAAPAGPAVPGGGGAVGNKAFAVADSCATQCITSGVAHRKGSGAELTVTTDTPAHIAIGVTDPDTGATTYRTSPSLTTSYAGAFDQLRAHTTYSASVAATDSAGAVSMASGTFTAGDVLRTVTITFEPIQVLTAPSTFTGTPVRIHVRVNGTFLHHSAWITGLAPIEGIGRHLDLEVWVVYQHDPGVQSAANPGGVPFGSCTQAPPSSSPLPIHETYEGSDKCQTWGAALAHGIDLDHGLAPGVDQHTIHVQLDRYSPHSGSGGDGLPPGYGESPLFHLRVPATIEVTTT
jgi:hypothetical protein